MAERGAIHFFTDNDVAESVGNVIVAAGHTLTRLREVMLTNAPDEVVAQACREQRLVLVTHNVKHFRRIVREQLAEPRRLVDHLCRLELKCCQVAAAERLKAEMPFVELEWARYESDPQCELRITIGDSYVRLNRDWVREV